MKVTKDKVENNQAYLTVEMDQAELDAEMDRAYRRLVKKYNIPGFRKGKTPRPILEQYLGRPALLEDAVNYLVNDACQKAIEEQGLKPISRPEVEVKTVEPLKFTAVVPLVPVVKLGEYRNIRMTQDVIELKEDDVNSTLDRQQHQYALWEPVERAAELNDLLVLDIESNIGAQPYINQKDAQFQILKDMEFPMPGFTEQLIGLKAGDAKEFKLTFPADYARAELAGKEASFKIKVSEIKIEKLPELNDEFAKQVNAEYLTLDTLKEKIRANLKMIEEQRAKEAFEEKLVDSVIEQSTLEFPPVMVEEEIDLMVREQMQRWQMSDKGLDEYLKSIKKTGDELRNDLRPMAVKRLKAALVLTQMAKDEKIQVTEPDIQQQMERLVRGASERKNELLKSLATPQGVQSMAQVVATRKTVERLVEIAKGIAKPLEEIAAEAKSAGEAAVNLVVDAEKALEETKAKLEKIETQENKAENETKPETKTEV